jgi:hypothetical protein
MPAAAACHVRAGGARTPSEPQLPVQGMAAWLCWLWGTTRPLRGRRRRRSGAAMPRTRATGVPRRRQCTRRASRWSAAPAS